MLHTMGDTFALHQALTTGARSAVIVGGGSIGLEMAEAFTARGLTVTLVEQAYHRLLDQPAYLPLGTTAHKQGRVAGETAVGGDREFAGSLGAQVVKVFELAVARTGIRDQEAVAAGFDALTVGSTQFDHKAYYPGAHQLQLRITGDRATARYATGRHDDAEVAKRIDIPAGALFHGMTVDGLCDLDLSYTPPFGSPLDAIQLAAQAWIDQVDGSQSAGRTR